MPPLKSTPAHNADPLIKTAERLAGDGDTLNCRQMADFAIGLVMGSGNKEVDPNEPHSEPFDIGLRCGQVLTMNNSPENVTAKVSAYLDATLGLVRSELGPDWDPRIELATEANRGNA